ncbi:MAG: C40 family peptidase [Clostridium sp.]
MKEKSVLKKCFVSIFLMFSIMLIICTDKSYGYTMFSPKLNIRLKSAVISTDKFIKVPGEGAIYSRVSRGATEDIPNEACKIVDLALEQLGSPYIEGAEGPKFFDEEGFVKYIYGNIDIKLEHSIYKQIQAGKPVSKNEIIIGDLVFFNSNKNKLEDVGIYVGNNRFIHADKLTGRIVSSNLLESYYLNNYVGARRIF